MAEENIKISPNPNVAHISCNVFGTNKVAAVSNGQGFLKEEDKKR